MFNSSFIVITLLLQLLLLIISSTITPTCALENTGSGIKIKAASSSGMSLTEDFTIHTSYQSLSGSRVKLPCDVSIGSDDFEDSITLILWYRGDRKSVPIYSVDARSVNLLSLAKHHSSDHDHSLKGRIKFEIQDHGNDGAGRGEGGHSTGTAASSPSSESSLSSGSSSGSSIKAGSLYRRKNSASTSSSSSSASSSSHEVMRRQLMKAFLVIDPVMEEDTGTYLCRVDFKWARTVNTVTNLTVIVPPRQVIIRDDKNDHHQSSIPSLYSSTTSHSPASSSSFSFSSSKPDQLDDVSGNLIGPYDEGSSIRLSCESYGGHPAPSLVWLKNGIIIDDSYSTRYTPDHLSNHSSSSAFNATPSIMISGSSSSSGSNPVVVNELLLTSLQRSDLFSILSCRAWNSNITSSVTSSVTLDMNLKPVDVKIVSFKRTLTAGEKTEVICQSRGSRPPATLNWFLNDEPVTHFVSQSFSEDGNLTTSILNFLPFPSADGQVLKCQSESAITGKVFMTDDEDVDNDDAEDAAGGEREAGSSSDENGDPVGSSGSRSSVDPVIDGSRLSKSDEQLMLKKKVMKGKKGSGSNASSSSTSSKIGNQSVPSKSTIPDVSSSSVSLSNILTTSKSKSTPVSNPVNNSTASSSSPPSPKSPDSKSYSSQGKQQQSQQKSKKTKTHHPHQISDEWQLQIFYAPSCREGQNLSYEAAIGETIAISCDVTSSPAASKFTWIFHSFLLSPPYSLSDDPAAASSLVMQIGNTSNFHDKSSKIGTSATESSSIQSKPHASRIAGNVYSLISSSSSANAGKSSQAEYTHGHKFTKEGNRSWLYFTPKSRQDFGTLQCSATNEIGSQRKACVFNVYSASPPDPVHDCLVRIEQQDAVLVACAAGSDGGLKQYFILEAYAWPEDHLVANLTSNEDTGVRFMVMHLQPKTSYSFVIYAVNVKGTSAKTSLTYEHPIDAHVSNDPASQSSSNAAPSSSDANHNQEVKSDSGSKDDHSLQSQVGLHLKNYLRMLNESNGFLIVVAIVTVLLPSLMLIFTLSRIRKKGDSSSKQSIGSHDDRGSDTDSRDFNLAHRSIPASASATAGGECIQNLTATTNPVSQRNNTCEQSFTACECADLQTRSHYPGDRSTEADHLLREEQQVMEMQVMNNTITGSPRHMTSTMPRAVKHVSINPHFQTLQHHPLYQLINDPQQQPQPQRHDPACRSSSDHSHPDLIQSHNRFPDYCDFCPTSSVNQLVYPIQVIQTSDVSSCTCSPHLIIHDTSSTPVPSSTSSMDGDQVTYATIRHPASSGIICQHSLGTAYSPSHNHHNGNQRNYADDLIPAQHQVQRVTLIDESSLSSCSPQGMMHPQIVYASLSSSPSHSPSHQHHHHQETKYMSDSSNTNSIMANNRMTGPESMNRNQNSCVTNRLLIDDGCSMMLMMSSSKV